MNTIPSTLTLNELQLWMRWVITDPRGVPQALSDPNPKIQNYHERYQAPKPSGHHFISTTAETSIETRLSIYAEAYFSRLLESLGSDFSRLRHLMGDLDFQLLISEYLKAYPSKNFNVGEVGLNLPEFLNRKNSDPCLIELAAFETQLIKTFYSIDKPGLNPQAFDSLSDDEWTILKLEIDPSVKILNSFWPLIDFWNLIDQSPVSKFRKMNTETPFLIWRKNYQVQFRQITPLEGEALSQLQAGLSLSDTLEIVAQKFSTMATPDELSAQVMQCFSRWLTDGVISNLII
jgi:hypothetical protein